MEKGSIYGVALGPGDPELITLKALKCLQRVDVIFYPTTLNSKGQKSSMAMRVLKYLELDEAKLRPVEVAMKYDRTEVNRTYHHLANECITLCKQGKNVAVVSEGDISFYSTFAYLIDDIKQAQLNYEMIPGVPAFILGGSLGKLPVCTQNDKVLVLPQVDDEAALARYTQENETVVLMKVSKVKKWIASFIEAQQLSFFYGEYMGTDKEFTCNSIALLKERRIPYFSIIIIKR
ncbi:precorrin-2 C(20)-methyltransferase [Carboxylicivirga sp. M1479]|uniref:precorrin-2 C(20)-methyltransferase n=1 Tax=Carboxylicivirga sp. M1479 TaxID=2594476 RepID=UPI0011783D42|nr:precorrin-2 C(20)-methyltransferase [Carboxylicivirga sp. M1479]TRX70220.1 precorrin-2 C(20)-methyltransferase [Carboxylicivirga sp. M1479]